MKSDRKEYALDSPQVRNAKAEYDSAEKTYLENLGADSLDRVILLEPLETIPWNYKVATRYLRYLIKRGKPAKQVPKEIWESLVF